jgi:TrmH family RNA methyltransferase
MTGIQSSNITIVLVEPTEPGNVGSVARAMDNMGIQDLRLVRPCEYFHPEARMFAMNARYLLRQAKAFETLEEAVKDCHLIVGTTARQRERIKSLTSLHKLPELFAEHKPGLNIAFVFGTEKSGLNNQDMSYCNEWISIPTFGKSSSLNLAQAVLVVLYELSKLIHGEDALIPREIVPAPSGQIEAMKSHFFRILEKIGFLRHTSSDVLWVSFSDLIGRAKPDERDVQMIRGFFNKIEVSLRRGKIVEENED